MSDFFLN